MKIIFIRHGDPDYTIDSLTERGKIEAEALSKHIDYYKIDDVFLSPLGRAQKTAEYSLKVLNKEGITYDWLREFNPYIDINEHPDWIKAYPGCRIREDGTYEPRICWDMIPKYLNENPIYYENPNWRNGEICTQTDLLEKYDAVCEGIDKILASYGYVRDGYCYKVEQESEKTIAIFCHLGITCVMLSHLLNISPFSLWHGTCIAPTGVTTVYSEEREQGCALFRARTIGEVSHLIMENIEPSSAGAFAEVFSDKEGRH